MNIEQVLRLVTKFDNFDSRLIAWLELSADKPFRVYSVNFRARLRWSRSARDNQRGRIEGVTAVRGMLTRSHGLVVNRNVFSRNSTVSDACGLPTIGKWRGHTIVMGRLD
jgi:hypothetical protein